MIKRKNYNVLIERVKLFAKQNAKAYRQRVVLLGVLGYAYIFLVLAILIGLMIWMGWLLHYRHGVAALVKFIVFLAIISWAILRSLWIKTEPPTGFLVDEKSAPKLFAVIKEICERQKCRLPDSVFLNNDFNAFISQVPRLGIFGWYKNYLVLGLPYMLASDLDQFKAVIVHEFGHFSGAHGRTGIWLYRIRASWYNIMASFEQDRVGNFIFGWFFNWYVPYFNAYSFVLAREHEYEADRYANDYAGARANAEELVNAMIKGSNNSYWQTIWGRVKDEPAPPKDVFTKAVASLKDPIPTEQYREKLRQALNIRTQNLDTHPALKDRLAALGYHVKDEQIVDGNGTPLVCQKPIVRSAADELLDTAMVQNALAGFDQDWFSGVEAEWKKRYQQIQEYRAELADLERKKQNAPLNENEMVRRAVLVDELYSRDEAIVAIRELLTQHPHCADGHFRLGIILVEQNDAGGLEHLKKAMELDTSFKTACLAKISWYHESKGDYDRVENALDDLDESSLKDQEDRYERNNVAANHAFKTHGLSEDVVVDLVAQLQPFAKELDKAYLFQKEMKTYPQEPMYVLAIKSNPGFWRSFDIQSFNQKLLDKLLAALKLKIIRGTYYLIIGDPKIIHKAKKINGALIFSRK